MKLDNRLTLVVAAIIAIAVIAGGWFLGVSPQLAAASASTVNASQVSDQNTSMAAQIQTLTAAKAKLPAMQATLAALQTSIPDTLQTTSFLDGLNSIASSTGVTLTSISIGTLTPYAKPTGVGPYSDSLVTPSNFGTATVNIAVTGTPSQDFAFVHALQYGSRLVLVTSITTALSSTTSTNTLTVTGTTYVMSPAIAKIAVANG